MNAVGSGSARMRTVRVDLHSHTRYSPDARMTPAELVARAAAASIDRIAVTDHDTIDGALEAHELDAARVIVGEEIECGCGTHLIGLFLHEWIPPALSVEETAERIRAQGGVVYAPHPYAYALRASWHAERAMAVADVIEAFNSRAFLPRWNRRAAAAALERALPCAAGSDAHFALEVGRCYAEMPDFVDAASFRAAVRLARVVAIRTGTPLVHFASRALQTVRRLTGQWPSAVTHGSDGHRDRAGDSLSAARRGRERRARDHEASRGDRRAQLRARR